MFTQGVSIENLEPPPASAGLQIQPTISASAFSSRDESDQFVQQDWNKDTIRPSLDARWGISSESKLLATIYPDFSQVEADVRQLNLNQRFAFYYPEREDLFSWIIWIFFPIRDQHYTRDPLSILCMELNSPLKKKIGLLVSFKVSIKVLLPAYMNLAPLDFHLKNWKINGQRTFTFELEKMPLLLVMLAFLWRTNVFLIQNSHKEVVDITIF